VIGTDIVYEVELINFTKNNVTDPKDIEKIKEIIQQMPQILSDIIGKECLNHPLDSVDVDITEISYIEPEDVRVNYIEI
jgi:hypothetical protein